MTTGYGELKLLPFWEPMRGDRVLKKSSPHLPKRKLSIRQDMAYNDSGMITEIHPINGSVMLSEAKHLCFSFVVGQRKNLRFFASLRMTFT
jgi:hypothetical protein